MIRNTTCIDDDHHEVMIDYDIETFSNEPAREYCVNVLCAKCGATAKHYIDSEDQNWVVGEGDNSNE